MLYASAGSEGRGSPFLFFSQLENTEDTLATLIIALKNKGGQCDPNGPAIWGGCVTRRKHRAESWYFSQKTVTVQGGYGALFAVRVQILLSITRVAVQV